MEKPVKQTGKRRLARELAIQFLYQQDLNQQPLPQAFASFWSTQPSTSDDVRLFAEALIRGTLDHQPAIDETIRKYTEHWELERIAAVDRNILRLAIYEMLHRDDIPPVVSINEAVDIAKRFSTGESGGFVNGILDRFKNDLTRPARIAAGPTE